MKKAKKDVAERAVKLTAKCLMDHKWVMTDEQIAEARICGCAFCPTCGNAATIEDVAVSDRSTRPKGGKK